MNALSLFTGIMGIDLACEWAGIETVAMCERDPFCQKVIRKHKPDIPLYDDVCTLSKEVLDRDGIGPIDLIHGGYPCQPFSNAGKRRGKDDDRHLWPEVFRLIQALQPRWFVGENVAGHKTLGLDDVLSDLDSIGYAWESFAIPSAAVGAPHERYRIFILAYPESLDSRRLSIGKEQTFTGPAFGGEDVAYASGERCGETGEYQSQRSTEWTAGGGRKRHSTRSVESELGRMLDGISGRLDEHRWPGCWGEEQKKWEPARLAVRVKNRDERIKALGNAVNPHQIYPFMVAIKQIDDMTKGESA